MTTDLLQNRDPSAWRKCLPRKRGLYPDPRPGSPLPKCPPVLHPGVGNPMPAGTEKDPSLPPLQDLQADLPQRLTWESPFPGSGCRAFPCNGPAEALPGLFCISPATPPAPHPGKDPPPILGWALLANDSVALTLSVLQRYGKRSPAFPRARLPSATPHAAQWAFSGGALRSRSLPCCSAVSGEEEAGAGAQFLFPISWLLRASLG